MLFPTGKGISIALRCIQRSTFYQCFDFTAGEELPDGGIIQARLCLTRESWALQLDLEGQAVPCTGIHCACDAPGLRG
ncbi:MAG: hypothetical protein NVSMB62_06780 [Acidobacteriaceae bacterium]